MDSVERFLRLFARYRFACVDRDRFRSMYEISQEGHDASVERWVERERRALADRDFWRERAERLEAACKEANALNIKSTQTVADFMSQLHCGRKIYEHAPALPDKPPNHEPIPKMRQQARVRVQQDEAKFAADLQSYVSQRVDYGSPSPAGAAGPQLVDP